MKTDKDRPSTWVQYKDGMCQECNGSCCTLPVEVHLADLIRLNLVTEDEALGSIKKIAKRLIREKVISSYRTGTQLFMLASRPSGDCVFLDPYSRRCTVYEKRPEVCRNFPLSQSPRLGLCPVRKKCTPVHFTHE